MVKGYSKSLSPELAPLVEAAQQVLGLGIPLDIERLRSPASVLASDAPRAQTQVWRLSYANGQRIIAKHFGHHLQWQRSLKAYQQWLPLLDCPGWRAPQLKGWDVSTVFLSELPGQPREAAALAEPHWHAAGQVLHAIHTLPFKDSDPLPLRAALGQRAEAALRQGEAWLPAPLRGRLCRRLAALDQLGDATRVICHRDFGPRNWLVAMPEERAPLGLIDFEEMHPDHPLVDLSRVFAAAPNPRMMRAFAAGYGSQPEVADLELMQLLDTLRSLNWAAGRGLEAVMVRCLEQIQGLL